MLPHQNWYIKKDFCANYARIIKVHPLINKITFQQQISVNSISKRSMISCGFPPGNCVKMSTRRFQALDPSFPLVRLPLPSAAFSFWIHYSNKRRIVMRCGGSYSRAAFTYISALKCGFYSKAAFNRINTETHKVALISFCSLSYLWCPQGTGWFALNSKVQWA